jgi:hypothetical protein
MTEKERPVDLLKWSQDLKRQDRENLAKIDPTVAQALAESVLNPKFAKIADGESLDWPGDLGDDWEPQGE